MTGLRAEKGLGRAKVVGSEGARAEIGEKGENGIKRMWMEGKNKDKWEGLRVRDAGETKEKRERRKE
eukprot:3323859-Pleurochrysis_carterae.AAC.7